MRARKTKLDRRRAVMAKARCDGRRTFGSQREASAGGAQFFKCGHCGKWHHCLPLDALLIGAAVMAYDREEAK